MPVQATTLVKASTFYTGNADADITDGETVVIGGKTYTFDATPADTDGIVTHVTGIVANLTALAAAVNLTAGGAYAASMTKNLYCDAVYPAAVSGQTAAETLQVVGRTSGAVGNLITATIGTSALTLDNATLENGAGDIDAAINELQAGAQLNSDVLSFLDAMEKKPLD